MTTQVRFGSPISGLLQNAGNDFLGTVLWRASETANYGNADSEFSLRTIGMCWKQQCLDRSLPKLTTGDVRFLTLDRAIEAADSGSILAVLGQVRRETSPSRRRPKGNLKQQTKETLRLSREATELLRLWLADRAGEAEESPLALLACCELLVLYGGQFPAEVIGGLWRAALAGALTQSESFVQAAATDDWQNELSNDSASPESWLQAGLLPFVCGLLFDDVKGAPSIARTGRSTLNAQLLQVTAGDGTPVGKVFDALPDFLALWADGLLVARLFDQTLWKTSAAKRFDKMLRRLAASVRSNEAVTCTPNGDSSASILRTATELNNSSATPTWAHVIGLAGSARRKGRSATKARSKKKNSGRAKTKISKADIPSWQSDDSDAACLRTSWATDASVVTVRTDSEPVKLELAVDGVPLFAGAWRLELAEAGDVLELANAWECICWNSDSDGDYLELQLEFEGGPLINRYIYLSRSEQFAIISDIVSGSEPNRIDVATLLPLAEGVTLEDSPNGRDQILKAGSKSIRVFPLSLPQDPGIGTAAKIGLDYHDQVPCLALSHASESGTMFAPIVLDWAPERQAAATEWRKLTVTRAGEIDPTGAVAFRLHVGKLHLVLYRSLAGLERYRTFLGYQAECETVIGKFTKSGIIQELLIVE
ncbi:MAG: hypothetical protein HQ518_06320 [Rhodopirellula sp.]|nr:hypothetical protein [Rhodopirellula sp.]